MQIEAYACCNKNDDLRMWSSSGAVFSALASYVLSQSGIVYGVTMSKDCYSAEYIAVTNEAELWRLRGSKYLQAKIGDSYGRVKNDLAAGKIVLFSGTGCQINGLQSFLKVSKISCEKLICVDVICHGVPSPALWREYAKHQEKAHNGKLKWINFRCKDDSWADFGMKETVAEIPTDEIQSIYISKDKDPYMQIFLRNDCLRPSCYACTAKENKMSDITIADFWGIKDAAPEMDDGKGTSLVLLRTEKGVDVFRKIENELRVKEVSYEAGVKNNPAEYRSAARPPQRDTFFTDMKNMSFPDLAIKYAAPIRPSFKTRVKRQIKRAAMPILKILRMEGHHSNLNYGLLFTFQIPKKQ